MIKEIVYYKNEYDHYYILFNKTIMHIIKEPNGIHYHKSSDDEWQYVKELVKSTNGENMDIKEGLERILSFADMEKLNRISQF